MPERTFGWIQDPGKLSNLRKAVEVFDPSSPNHLGLVNGRLRSLVKDNDVFDRLLDCLNTRPLKISHAALKGNGLGGARANDPCNGIMQAAICGQTKKYLSDWAAENFVRWVHALGFIDYDPHSDTYALSAFGEKYLNDSSVLEEAFLSYPPAVRILRLLYATTDDIPHLTKYEIGRQLGFVGEAGFTSLPQNLLVRELSLPANKHLRSKMLSDWDGTSDKYARMIASWLAQVGWIKKEPKTVTALVAGQTYSYAIPQAYTLTDKGREAYRRAVGASKYARTKKNVFFEMLATKEGSRRHLRMRRALMIKALEGRGYRTLAQIQSALRDKGITIDPVTIADDLLGLTNIGLDIQQDASGNYRLNDAIDRLTIPAFSIPDTQPSDVQELKDKIRLRLNHLPHQALVLIDLSFDSRQNRQFELETMQLFSQCGFSVAPLIGGANRPDGVVYSGDSQNDYGLVVDSKAYSQGFNCGAGQRDEMQRYVLENIRRPKNHPTAWWGDYPQTLQPPDQFRFLFVTSRLIGDFKNQFARLSQITDDALGAGITAANLLLFAEAIQAKTLTVQDGYNLFGTLDEVKF